jgi:hypothetical protein
MRCLWQKFERVNRKFSKLFSLALGSSSDSHMQINSRVRLWPDSMTVKIQLATRFCSTFTLLTAGPKSAAMRLNSTIIIWLFLLLLVVSSVETTGRVLLYLKPNGTKRVWRICQRINSTMICTVYLEVIRGHRIMLASCTSFEEKKNDIFCLPRLI